MIREPNRPLMYGIKHAEDRERLTLVAQDTGVNAKSWTYDLSGITDFDDSKMWDSLLVANKIPDMMGKIFLMKAENKEIEFDRNEELERFKANITNYAVQAILDSMLPELKEEVIDFYSIDLLKTNLA